MATEESSQHQQHAQWLVSLATDHFAQPSTGSVAQDKKQLGDSQPAEDESQIVDMSGHAIVKLAPEASEVTPVVPPATGSPFNLRRTVKKRKIDHDEPEQHEFKLIRPKERVSAKNFDMRRPVRPIDRQKMRPWLKNLLDTGSVFGLIWLHRDDGVFQISWRHASRLGWNLETDGDVFERWARHTGIFKDGDEPEPKRWKANFRCALHSLPDVKELTSPTDRKGRYASRTYRFLRPSEIQPPVKRKQRYNIQLPYSVYENQASEDSGSPQADSDDRNTDEEAVVPEQVLAFPHCDHDYAIRLGGKAPDKREQPPPEVLSKQNSGYVLIKAKDNHALEFRLTPPHGTVQSSGTKKSSPASKSSSLPKKGKVNRKKPTTGSAVKKGKGKASQKTGSFKKDGKQTKMPKKLSEKDPSPATKYSLKSLLCGQKNAVGGKKTKGGQSGSQANKKAKRVKKTVGHVAKEKGKTDEVGKGTPPPSKPQGLDALLEAANQLEGMSPLTSAPATAPTNTPSRAVPKRTSRTKVASAHSPAKPSPIRTKALTTSHLIVPNVATPIVLAAHPMVAATRTTGATFAPIPVLATGAPTAVPSQVSLNMLQKLIGLSAVPAIPASSVPMTLVPGQVLTGPIVSTKPDVKQRPQSNKHTQNKKKGKVAVASAKVELESNLGAPSASTIVTQPEETSYLKQLLRLTVPSVAVSTVPISTTTTTTTTTASQIIPAAPQVPSPLLAPVTTAGVTVKEYCVTDTCVVKSEIQIGPTSDQVALAEESAVTQSGQIGDAIPAQQVTESSQAQPLTEVTESSQAQPLTEATSSCFPDVKVDTTSHVVESMEVEETPASCFVSVGSVSSVCPSVSTVSTSATHGTNLLQSSDGMQLSAPAPQVLAQTAVNVAQAPPASSCVPQVTLCLPQAILGPQSLQASGTGAQTMTLTLPQGSVSGLQGQGSSTTTFAHSIDLLQLLNFCVASGNGQVIIKTEPSISTDMSAMNSTHTTENAPTSHSQGGEISAVPKFILVDACQGASSAQTVVEETGQSIVAASEAAVSVASSASSSAITFPGSSLSVNSTTMDSAVLSGAVDSLASSPAIQCPASSVNMDSHTLSAMGTDHTLSTMDTSPELATAITASESVQKAAVMQTRQEVTQGDMSLTVGDETVNSQFIQETDMSALSTDQQGAESFIVENILL